MPIARHLARVVEVIQHSKLQRQLMQIWRNGFAIHSERGVAVAHRLSILFQIAENLVVCAVFFNDVNHVLDPALLRARKGNLLLRRFHPVRLHHHGSPSR